MVLQPKVSKNHFQILPFIFLKKLGKIEFTFHINTWWNLPLCQFLATSTPVFFSQFSFPVAPHLVAFSHLVSTRFPTLFSVLFTHLPYVHYNRCLTKVESVSKKIHFTLITNIIRKDFWMVKMSMNCLRSGSNASGSLQVKVISLVSSSFHIQWF